MTRRRDLLALAGGVASAGLAGCVGSFDAGRPEDDDGFLTPRTTPATTPAPATAGEVDRLVTGARAFAADLHRRLTGAVGTATNALAAPYGVSTALSMATAGARGETAAEMAATLRVDLPRERLHPAVAALDARVDPPAPTDGTPTPTPTPRGPNDVPFTVATVNALWGQEGYPFADEFLWTLAAYYGGGLRTLDFAAAPERSRDRVNRWVAGRTGDRITALLPPGSVNEDTRFLLTNAVYFRSNWATRFDERWTEPRPFTAIDGTTARVPTMADTREYPYAAVDGHQVVELPYENREYGMVIVLPRAGAFRETERRLDAARLADLFDALAERPGTLLLPRFTVRTGLALNGPLSAMGMPTAFDPGRADFSGVVEGGERPDLYLTGVYHQTFIEVAEWGTEAAGATGAGGGAGPPPPDPFEMHVDRPFLFAIRHRPTGAVLFLGRVVDAAAAA